jgi:arylsulfatase A-like enzyme
VFAALDRHKLAERTIVVVTSDTGAQPGRGSKEGHKANGDLRGAKGTAWEGGHRVAFLVRWPGRVPAATTCDETICHVDVMSTLAAALELPLPADAGPDSWNVLPAWLGETYKQPIREATVCAGSNSLILSIRRGPWKLLAEADGTYRGKDVAPVGKEAKRTLAEPELYDLAADPQEQNNLAETKPEKLQELADLLARYRTQGFSRPGWKK